MGGSNIYCHIGTVIRYCLVAVIRNTGRTYSTTSCISYLTCQVLCLLLAPRIPRSPVASFSCFLRSPSPPPRTPLHGSLAAGGNRWFTARFPATTAWPGHVSWRGVLPLGLGLMREVLQHRAVLLRCCTEEKTLPSSPFQAQSSISHGVPESRDDNEPLPASPCGHDGWYLQYLGTPRQFRTR